MGQITTSSDWPAGSLQAGPNFTYLSLSIVYTVCQSTHKHYKSSLTVSTLTLIDSHCHLVSDVVWPGTGCNKILLTKGIMAFEGNRHNLLINLVKLAAKLVHNETFFWPIIKSDSYIVHIVTLVTYHKLVEPICQVRMKSARCIMLALSTHPCGSISHHHGDTPRLHLQWLGLNLFRPTVLSRTCFNAKGKG